MDKLLPYIVVESYTLRILAAFASREDADDYIEDNFFLANYVVLTWAEYASANGRRDAAAGEA